MKRLAFLAFAFTACGGPASAPPPVADFSGLWLMTETDAAGERAYSRCWLQIAQTGDRVTLKSWAEDNEWACEGRGAAAGNVLKFRWLGGARGWRGRAEVQLRDGELRGTYQREDVETGVQYTRGVRADRRDAR